MGGASYEYDGPHPCARCGHAPDRHQDGLECEIFLDTNKPCPCGQYAEVILSHEKKTVGWRDTDPAPPVADRHDNGKADLSAVDCFPTAQAGVALNQSYGASKYATYNFMKGAKNSLESYNCARRHMLKWHNGEDLVPDAVAAGFDVHHIDAAIWNLMRLREELEKFPERDNRPCKVLK